MSRLKVDGALTATRSSSPESFDSSTKDEPEKSILIGIGSYLNN
jgi:hypothetical protein